MAVHIRLARHGTKKAPQYRIVVTDQRNPRDGRFIENIGTYDPLRSSITLNQPRLEYWRTQGARTSATLERLVKRNARAQAQGG